MLKKFLYIFLIALFSLSLMPMPSKACSSAAVKPGTLVKASTPAVYYYAADGKRYVFPNQKTYNTWFVDFNLVISISDEVLGEIPIGGNVTYKPGSRLVKITTDPKVYWVDKEGTLRHVATESTAKQLFGSSWYKSVDDVPDSFFINYKVGLPIQSANLPTIEYNYSINQDKQLSAEPDPQYEGLGTIDLEGYISGNVAKLSWSANNFYSPSGFKVVMSNQPDPVYPGDFYHYLSDPNVRSDTWHELAPGTYYFRVCEYLGGKCGIYSNNLILKVAGTTTDTSNKSITLKAIPSGNTVTLKWDPNFYSAKGFKVVQSLNPNPVYPGDKYHYLSDPGTRSDTWTGLSAGTYHFRVCEYLGGACGTYSNDVTVTVEGQTYNNSNGTINLTGYYDNAVGKVFLNWTVNNMYSEKGFKIVNSLDPNPVYPGNDYHYLSSPEVRADKWYGLAPATYHFRVCEYLGGACGIYSNDITVTVQ